MKTISRCTLLFLLLCASCVFHAAALASPSVAANPRERILMDAEWRFALGNAANQHKDFDFATVPFFLAKAGYGDGPASPRFDDRTWRSVDLPHDWAVELPFDQRGDGNHGSKAIGRNFPENSIGWYRKSFTVAKEDLGRRIGIDDHRRQGVKCFVVEPLHEHDGGCLRGGAAQENRSFDDTHRLQEKPKSALNPKSMLQAFYRFPRSSCKVLQSARKLWRGSNTGRHRLAPQRNPCRGMIYREVP